MSYTLSTMISMFRTDMNDQYEPYLWSDAEIKRHLSEAQDFFLLNTDRIATTETLTYKAGDTTVTFPSYITHIRSARNSDESRLDHLDKIDWDNYKGDTLWRTDTGVLTDLITDYTSKEIRLYPIPEEDGAFELDVYRVAKKDLETTGIMEVTDRPAQRVLLMGAKAYAYSKQDVDVYDSKAEMKLRALFEAQVQDYYYRVQNARRYARPVSYGGIPMEPVASRGTGRRDDYVW